MQPDPTFWATAAQFAGTLGIALVIEARAAAKTWRKRRLLVVRIEAAAYALAGFLVWQVAALCLAELSKPSPEDWEVTGVILALWFITGIIVLQPVINMLGRAYATSGAGYLAIRKAKRIGRKAAGYIATLESLVKECEDIEQDVIEALRRVDRANARKELLPGLAIDWTIQHVGPLRSEIQVQAPSRRLKPEERELFANLVISYDVNPTPAEAIAMRLLLRRAIKRAEGHARLLRIQAKDAILELQARRTLPEKMAQEISRIQKESLRQAAGPGFLW